MDGGKFRDTLIGGSLVAAGGVVGKYGSDVMPVKRAAWLAMAMILVGWLVVFFSVMTTHGSGTIRGYWDQFQTDRGLALVWIGIFTVLLMWAGAKRGHTTAASIAIMSMVGAAVASDPKEKSLFHFTNKSRVSTAVIGATAVGLGMIGTSDRHNKSQLVRTAGNMLIGGGWVTLASANGIQ